MKLLAVDGNSILNRSFYGIKLLSTKKGMYTNAIFGFLTVMNRMLNDIKPDSVAVAFDLKAPTFRHKIYDQYKGTRKGMPDELAVQLPVVKELITLMGFKIIESEGFEADDILGTLSEMCANQGAECVIATGDRDSLQLISENVTVRLATNKEAVIYDTAKIKEDYGVEPLQLIEVKALMGDASDNIPGVKGIGEKTAFSLIEKYGNIEYIYKHISEIDVKDRIRNLLSSGEEIAKISRELAVICRDVPLGLTLEDCVPCERDSSGLYKKLSELEMKSLISKFGLDSPKNTENTENTALQNNNLNIKIIKNPDIEIVKSKLEALPFLDYILERDSEGICEISIDLGDEGAVFDFNAENIFHKLAELKKPMRTYEAKSSYLSLLSSGVEANIIFDAVLAAYLLDSNSKDFSLKSLRENYLDMQTDENIKIHGFSALCDILQERVKNNSLEELLYETELPLSEALASMEICGFRVDAAGIENFGDNILSQIESLKSEIFDLAGEEFNLNSTKELGVILFEKLMLPVGKKTKTGYSTNADVLEKLSGKHPVIDKVTEYRHLSKLHSTYVTGLLKLVGSDGRIRSKFKQTETRTGRISSTEPNMQNIPVRTKLGREMRKFFTAREGFVLLDADYSQIELRILAHISNDKNMIEGFKGGADIHTLTASEIFSVPPENITPELRYRAKAVNFGIVYGIGAYSLSQDINVSVSEAKEYIENYLAAYSGVKQYMENIISDAKANGYVKTMMGRRRDIPEILSPNHNVKSFGERVALNTPIQGTAADIIKIAMVKVYRRLKEENLNAKLILQIHDELIIEASVDDSEKAGIILKQEMENAALLSVPLTAEVSVGTTWYEAKA